MAPKGRRGKGKNDRKRGDGSVHPRRKDGRIIGYEVEVVVNGQRIRRLAPDAEAAEALRAKLVADRDAGVDVAGGEQTVQTWAETWYAQKARTKRPRTLDGYRGQLENYVLPVIGTTRLREVTGGMLQSLVNTIEDDIKRNTRYSGTRTAQAVGWLLRDLFELAVNRSLIARNPMNGVELPDHKAARVEVPTDEQLTAVLVAAHQMTAPALWHLYGLLGLRRGEAIGLRWSDVDLVAGTVTVRQQVQATSEQGVHTGPPKTDAGERTLPAPLVVVDLLRAWRPVVAARQLKAERWEDNDLVFPGRAGRPMWPSSVDHDWRTLRAAAELPESVKLHHLRHMVATLLDEAGATEALKVDILGHGKRTVTQRYTHARLSAMRRVLEAVAERVTRRAM